LVLLLKWLIFGIVPADCIALHINILSWFVEGLAICMGGLQVRSEMGGCNPFDLQVRSMMGGCNPFDLQVRSMMGGCNPPLRCELIIFGL
jgi:hypothetical protein